MQRRTSRSHSARMRQHGSNGSALADGVAALREQAATQARTLLDRAKAGGQEVLNVRRLYVAEELSTLGGAVRRAADTLHDRSRSAGLAEYADSVADRLDDAARYLERADVEDLVADAQDLVATQPAVFLTSMFLAGVAVARFVKASEPPKRGRRQARTSS